jgi:hypothetical protein
MEVDTALGALCAQQLGLVTLEQARAVGLTVHMVRHRVHAGHLVTVRRGVYRETAPAWPRAEQRILAAVLGAGEHAYASHDTACWLWELPLPGPMRLEVSVPRDRRPRGSDVVWHRTDAVPRRDVLLARGVPACPADRAIADVSARYSVAELAAMLDAALDAGHTTVARFARLVVTLAPARSRDRERLRAALRVAERGSSSARSRPPGTAEPAA